MPFSPGISRWETRPLGGVPAPASNRSVFTMLSWSGLTPGNSSVKQTVMTPPRGSPAAHTAGCAIEAPPSRWVHGAKADIASPISAARSAADAHPVRRVLQRRLHHARREEQLLRDLAHGQPGLGELQDLPLAPAELDVPVTHVHHRASLPQHRGRLLLQALGAVPTRDVDDLVEQPPRLVVVQLRPA